MKKISLFLAACCLAWLSNSFGSNVAPVTGLNFNINNPKVFIQNLGQFQLPQNIGNEKVLYAYDNGASMIYFTASGITYSFKKIIPKNEEEIERELSHHKMGCKARELKEKRIQTLAKARESRAQAKEEKEKTRKNKKRKIYQF